MTPKDIPGFPSSVGRKSPNHIGWVILVFMLALAVFSMLFVVTPPKVQAGGGWGPMYALDHCTTYPIDPAANGTGIATTTDSELIMATESSSGPGLVYVWNYTQTGLSQPIILPAGLRPEVLTTGVLGPNATQVIVTANYGDNTLGLYQKVDGIWQEPTYISTNLGPDGLAIGDFIPGNGNELAVSYWQDDQINLYSFVDGALSTPASIPSRRAGWDDLAPIDIGDDGFSDLLKMNGQGLGAEIELHRQTSTGVYFRSDIDFSNYSFATYATAIAVGDLTADGGDDFVTSSGNNALGVWHQDVAQGSFTLRFVLSNRDGYSAKEVFIADASPAWADGGRMDVYSLHSNRFSIHLQSDGKFQTEPGSFFSSESYQLPTSASNTLHSGILVFDRTGDGEPEVFVAGDDGLIECVHLPGYLPGVTLEPSGTTVPTSTSWPTLTPSVTPTPTMTTTPRPTATPTLTSTPTTTPTATCVPKGRVKCK